MLFRRRTQPDRINGTPSRPNVAAPEPLLKKLHYLQIDENDILNVHKLKTLMDNHTELITQRHYQLLSEIEELQGIIDRHSSLARLTRTFSDYLRSVPRIRLNEEYVHKRYYIGIIHSKIRLEPEWFVGAFTRIYEYFIPLVLQEFGKTEAAHILLSLNRILALDAQIVLEAYQRAYEFQHIESNSRFVEELIRIDKVKPLIEAVNASIGDAENVSAASDELSSSVQEVAGHAVQTAEQTEELIKQAALGQQIINDSLKGFLAMVDEIAETKHRFDDLFTSIENVTGVIRFIHEVADQTNLLALNASIEAARAGEEGRGFAVVADEVRRLANQTRSSVERITQLIEQVRRSAEEVGHRSEAMSEQIHHRVKQANEATARLDYIMKQVRQIGHASGNIAAIVEEQTAAAHHISARIYDALQQLKTVQELADETGRNIYQTSINMNEFRQQTIRNIPDLNDIRMIRVVKTDHLLWRWWVYNGVMGYHQINAEEVRNHHQCRLGKWYDKCRSNPKLAANPVFQKLDEPHQRIHQLAFEAAKHLEAGESEKAHQLLEPIHQASEEVVQLLDQLQQELQH